MSDTKITAKIDADISQLKSGMREAAESLKKAALNMRSSISQVSDSLDRATKDASKMREEFDRMLKLNQAPSGGFISNLTSSLGIANSSMKDLFSKMTGIGSQADLIIKSFESIKALAEYAIEEMWVRPLKDAAEVAERNARSIKEASDMNREYRDSTTALMREYGQLNEAEAMSNVSKQKQIELLAKLSEGYAGLAEKVRFAGGSISNFDEIMTEKLSRDKASKLEDIESQLKQLRDARANYRQIQKNNSKRNWLNFANPWAESRHADASKEEQRVSEQIIELMREKAKVMRQDDAGLYARMAAARKKDEAERRKATEASAIGQMSDEMAVSGMNQFDRRRFDLGKKVERLSVDISTDDGRRKLEEYRRNVLAQIQADEDKEKQRVQEEASREQQRTAEQAAREQQRAAEQAAREQQRAAEQAARDEQTRQRNLFDARRALNQAEMRLADLKARHKAEAEKRETNAQLAELDRRQKALRKSMGEDTVPKTARERRLRRRNLQLDESIAQKQAQEKAGERVTYTPRERKRMREREKAEKEIAAIETKKEKIRQRSERREERQARRERKRQLGEAERGVGEAKARIRDLEAKATPQSSGVAASGMKASKSTSFAPSPLAKGVAGASAAATGSSAIGQQLSAIQAILQQMSTKFYFVQG